MKNFTVLTVFENFEASGDDSVGLRVSEINGLIASIDAIQLIF